MLVCSNCRKKMKCIETGRGVRFGDAHVYPGDMFLCENCGASVILTNPKPTYDPDKNMNTLQMKEGE